MARVMASLVAVILSVVALAEPTRGSFRPDPLEPAAAGGVEAVDRALARLSTHARLLVIGAHPDDEDNSLLTYVARGLGGEAAYLSLSRGEGGQNLIGPELGEPLGVIRTGELMAARRIEGTRQYFSRAYDFGYTRSLEEAFERWPREVLREDAIRAARRFKPQVVVAIFPPDARAGHGQHQASAVIAQEVFDLAGEPGDFEDLGLPGWQPKALYRRAWSRDDATLGFSLAHLDPISGRSLAQISAESRSQHRSQDMGRRQPLGEYRGGLRWIAGGAGEGGEEIFAGIDTRLAGIASSLPAGELRDRLEVELSAAEASARAARAGLNPVALGEAVPAFAEILERLGSALSVLGHTAPERAVGGLLLEKVAVAEQGLAAAAGIFVDAVADSEAVPIGETLAVTASIWPSSEVSVEARSVRLVSASGWKPAGGEKTAPTPEDRGVQSWQFEVKIPTSAQPTVPYYLVRPRQGDLYDWSAVPGWLRGAPYLTNLTASFEIVVDGTPIVLEREVVHAYADQAVGEVRRPLRAVPAVNVAIRPSLEFWALGEDSSGLDLDVALSSNLDREVEGRFRVQLPGGWNHFGEEPIVFEPLGRQLYTIRASPPADLQAGSYRVGADFAISDGRAHAATYAVIDYPHIRPASLEIPAVTNVQALSIELPELDRIGYVRGASDRVPELLEKIGLPIEVLDLDRVHRTDLSHFDAIVIGSRAYEVDPMLRARNGSFLRYLEDGGLLIVQYQQYQFVRGSYAPLPLEISRPHGRITDETSPVHVLEPGHPAFNRPNKIGESDWEGWVQERGLYFAGEWDEAYEPLLALQDPGDQPEQRGGLLVARVGEGTYVYTGLSFFRELPAGVAGAFRLFANLLALGDDDPL